MRHALHARNEWAIPNIERKGGFKFQKIAPPQPAEMVAAAAKVVISQVRGVHKGAAKLFMDAAAELLAAGAGEHDEGADPTEMLAAALAKLAGHGELRTRSLLTSHSGQTTLSFVAGGTTEIRTPTYVWNFLRQRLEENDLQIRRLTLCTDHKGAVFDVPSELAEKFVALSEDQAPGHAHHHLSLRGAPGARRETAERRRFRRRRARRRVRRRARRAGRLLRRARTRRVQPRGTRARRSRRRPGVRRARPRVKTKRESARRYSILFGSRRAVWKPRDATRVECVVKHA